MFEAKIATTELLEIINTISAVTDEAKIKLSPQGWHILVVDAAHVMMAEIIVGKNAFTKFEASDCEFGLDVDKLKITLKVMAEMDIHDVGLRLTDETLVVSCCELTREIALIPHESMSDPKVPALAATSSLVMSPATLYKTARLCESVTDHITLSVTPDGFSARGEDEKESVTLTLSKDQILNLECAKSVKSLYPLDYMLQILKGVERAIAVSLAMGQDYPLRIAAHLGKTGVMFLLAPRIEGEH